MSASTLESLGWESWFETRREDLCGERTSVARVASVDRDQLLVLVPGGSFRAKLSGRLMFKSAEASERPCVGDWVCVEASGPGQTAVVHGVLERRTWLRRKAAGESVEYQMIAANIDFVIVVQSCHYDFNLKRLERYWVMIEDGGAQPLVLLTKTDLVSADELQLQVEQILNAGLTDAVLTLSNVTAQGLGQLEGILIPGKTYCFVGSSGVGKSTLINALVGRDLMKTSGVSGSGEGRHTTVRRELVQLENGALVIDNPGMREFGVAAADDGLEASFSDIMALASRCRFRDCSHSSEPGCAVLQALQRGEISAEHYANFGKLRQESAHYEMSYAEKRKKDREFGRFIKTAKKDLDD